MNGMTDLQLALYVVKNDLYFAWLALLIFFIGFCFSYVVYELNIRFLMWFPRWFVRVLARHVNPRRSAVRIFLTIFLFNSISIAVYMLSGLFIIFPYIIAFLTGMNIGLSVFIPTEASLEGYEVRVIDSPAKAVRIAVFSTLVLIIEVVVFSLALGMGLALASASASIETADFSASLFLAELISTQMNAYIYICVPLLALSAFFETSVIKGI